MSTIEFVLTVYCIAMTVVAVWLWYTRRQSRECIKRQLTRMTQLVSDKEHWLQDNLVMTERSVKQDLMLHFIKNELRDMLGDK